MKFVFRKFHIFQNFKNSNTNLNRFLTLNYENKIFNTVLELGDSYDEMYIITDPHFKDKKFKKWVI